MVQTLILILVIGVVAFFVEKYIPMAEPFKLVFRIVMVVVAVVLLLRALGVSIPGLHM